MSKGVERILYYEEIQEKFLDHVIRSAVRVATMEEIVAAETAAASGHCPCNIVLDEPGWLYDYRSCATCGRGLGAI